jgi:phosphotriesterase-related protein
MQALGVQGRVQTVLGPIAPDALGVTLPHEHLLIDERIMYQGPSGACADPRALEALVPSNLYELTCNWKSSLENLLLDEESARWDAELYRLEGGKAIVDVTPRNLGRDPVGLQRISKATGIHVIMGAGYYGGKTQPTDLAHRSEQDIAEEIAREITVGVGETQVRAGVVGEIGCSWPMTAGETKVLGGAAEAAKKTGACLIIHPGLDPGAPLAHLAAVEKRGLDPRRVVMAHMDHVDHARCDKRWLASIAETGCFLAFDHFGKEISYSPEESRYEMMSDAERIRHILWLIERGHGKQIHLSQDIALKVTLVQFGGFGYRHILRRVVPRLRRLGLSNADVRMLMVENPARAFAINQPGVSGECLRE